MSDDDVQYAMRRIGTQIEKIAEPILFAQLRLTLVADPARARPAIAQVLIDINGDLVRGQIGAEAMPFAIDLLQERLRDRLDHRAQRRRALRRRPDISGAGEWRHGDLASARPDYFDRPIEERRLVSRKSFSIDELTPDEAVLEMEQLDYDFYLFRELASHEDAVIEPETGESYRLTRLRSATVDPGPSATRVVVSESPAPVLTIEEAIERLEAIGTRFLFFAEATTHRGHIVYHRYDGHYGLISPE
ncbi:MAG: sigma 54 modulation/S30EA ribosomal C-terminal domain-containing protein [Acidimicrobiia bacterium]